MIQIGDFARLSGTTIVTLRHYADVGLLRPARIDEQSGYRYYEPSQLYEIQRILCLRELGLSLSAIEGLLREPNFDEACRRALNQARTAALVALREEQERLERIEARLRLLGKEIPMATFDVLLKTVPAQRVAALPVTIPSNDKVPEYLGAAYATLQEYVEETGVKVAGPRLAVWHTTAETLTDERADAMLPVDASAYDHAGVTVQELAAGTVASGVLRGSMDGLPHLHAAILDWIGESGHKVDGPFREIYFDTCSPEVTVEVQYPVRVGR